MRDKLYVFRRRCRDLHELKIWLESAGAVNNRAWDRFGIAAGCALIGAVRQKAVRADRSDLSMEDVRRLPTGMVVAIHVHVGSAPAAAPLRLSDFDRLDFGHLVRRVRMYRRPVPVAATLAAVKATASGVARVFFPWLPEAGDPGRAEYRRFVSTRR